ncbi:MAG: glycosyltransferase family 117 protein [Candidatus Eiseniibacteriota bacterium]
MRAALAVAVVALCVYLRTLAPGITEIDSGELATVAATLGIAHPSGYPLFAVLGRTWVLAAPMRIITWVNVLSAVLAAGAAFLVCRVIADVLPERLGRWRQVGAVTGAAAFAFHGTLWSVATVTEVHALQMFLDAALLHAVVRAGLWGRGPVREPAFLGAGYFAGLCLSNHLTSALLLPGVALGAWRRRRELRPAVVAGAALLAVLGASFYLVLPVRSAQEPLLDWGSPDTFESFMRHVSGAQYRVWMFSSGEGVTANLRELGAGMARFSWPLLALAAAGLWSARRVPGLAGGTLAMFALSAAYPLGYTIHDIATYFLPAFLVAAVWIGTGTAWVAEAAAAWRPLAKWTAARRVLPAVVLLPVVPLVGGWRAADRSRDATIEAMARSFLETPAPNAVVLNRHWDVLMSPALYLQHVEGVRPDLAVLDQEHFRRSWKVPSLRRHHADLLEGLEQEADELHRLVLRFERGEPYEAAEIQAAFETLIDGILAKGMQRGGAYVTQEVEAGIGTAWVRVPDGLLFRLEPPEGAAALGAPAPWPDLPPPGEGGAWADAARGYAAQMATYAGVTAMRLGDVERARDELARALAWNPADPVARGQWEALGE